MMHNSHGPDDLTAVSQQHYQSQHPHQPSQQDYYSNNPSQSEFSNYGPMYTSYMKSCRTNPYQRPTSAPSNAMPHAMYYPGFNNAAAAAAAAAAAGLYGSRPHNMYDYAASAASVASASSGNGSPMQHQAEVPR